MTLTKSELIDWYVAQHHALVACDPSVDEDALDDFITAQRGGDELGQEIERAGFTLEEIEDEAFEVLY